MTAAEKFERLPTSARILIRITYEDPLKSPKTLKGGNEFGVQEILDHPSKIDKSVDALLSALLFDYHAGHTGKNT
jgi:hypothetical protein